MVLAQAEEVSNYGELILKLAAAALPVIGGAFAFFQSVRRQPQTTNAPKISVVSLSHDALIAPDVLERKPEKVNWIDRWGRTLSFQFLIGLSYAVFGFLVSEPLFIVFGALFLVVGMGRLLWRIALRSFGDVTSDCVEMTTVVAGDLDEIVDVCVDAVQRLKGRVTRIDRDARLIDAVSNRGASMTLNVVPVAVERSTRWHRRSGVSGRYRLYISVQTSTPDAWTAGRNMRLARQFIEHVTGVRWHRPEPE